MSVSERKNDSMRSPRVWSYTRGCELVRRYDLCEGRTETLLTTAKPHSVRVTIWSERTMSSPSTSQTGSWYDRQHKAPFTSHFDACTPFSFLIHNIRLILSSLFFVFFCVSISHSLTPIAAYLCSLIEIYKALCHLWPQKVGHKLVWIVAFVEVKCLRNKSKPAHVNRGCNHCTIVSLQVVIPSPDFSKVIHCPLCSNDVTIHDLEPVTPNTRSSHSGHDSHSGHKRRTCMPGQKLLSAVNHGRDLAPVCMLTSMYQSPCFMSATAAKYTSSNMDRYSMSLKSA